jgi:hypothetical protein
MYEYQSYAPGANPWWPGEPREPAPADDQPRDYSAAVSEITVVVADTRWLVLVAGGLLVTDIGGAAAAGAALLGHRDAIALGSAGLLIPVLLCWLVATALVIRAELPVADALGGLRWATGARVTPSAPWPPLGVEPAADSDLEWEHAEPLIAAAVIRHARARLALCAAIVTSAAFVLWMVLALAFATVF